MRIALDASRTTVARVTGTERYALELIRALIRQNTQHDITLYFRDPPADGLFPLSDKTEERIMPFPRAWTHLRFAAALWQSRPDLTFVPAHTLPFFFPGRSMVTVHDLGFKHFPDSHTANSRRYLDITTRHSANRAKVVLADSRATADDLMRFYDIPVNKIHVVYPGVEAPQKGDVNAIRAKYHLPERYFLFIGTLQPRKNIARIVQAYAKYRSGTDDPAGLVLAGGKGWLFDEQWVAGVEGVQLTGYFDEADKGALYRGAIGLVFSTLYEGFGFPVIEAMYADIPVIASNTSSLPELVGDAGLLVDPLNIGDIASAMHKLDTNPLLRTALVTKGAHQRGKFTWEAAAEQVMYLLDTLLSVKG